MFEYATTIDRTGLYDGQSEEAIIDRYKRNYQIDTVSFAQVRRHAELEGQLTDQILASQRGDRAAVASHAYSTLYREIDWLTGTGGPPDGERWLALLHKGADVYEVGSGAGKLAQFLNDHGVNCVRTDISNERNSANQLDGSRTTDGVNLSDFVDRTYDYVISDQVAEHLHPADIIPHFTEARKILATGGSYIFRAPNVHCGPHDLSLVFDLDKPVFMHLHEFEWRDVDLIVDQCGYADAKAIFTVPGTQIAIPSGLYFSYLKFVEKTFGGRKNFKRLAKALYFPTQVWVKLSKA